jgi:hypothetical protein
MQLPTSIQDDRPSSASGDVEAMSAMLTFAAFSWSLQFHGAATRMPLGMIALSIASLAIFGLTRHALLTTSTATSVREVDQSSTGFMFPRIRS